MKIKFSHHAKRRTKLFKISESDIKKVLTRLEFHQGKHEIIKEIPGFKLPIKIVIVVEGATITIVTSYPLKRGRKK